MLSTLKGIAFRLTLAMVIIGSGLVQADEICDLVITDCGPQTAPRTLTVPSKAIAFSPRVPACPDSVIVPALPVPPAIVFLIDQSLSIRDYNDPTGRRYKAATDILDMVAAVVPKAQVSLVVFNESLLFDYRDDAFFKPIFPKNPDHAFDSYAPLTVLNKAFPDGRSGLDTLKGYLRTVDGKLVHQTKRRDGQLTDFVLAYQAARAILDASKAPKHQQFVILITDGEPQDTGNKQEVADLLKGKDIPTTFALFIGQSDNSSVPAGLGDFIKKVAKNGYSAANPRSTYFPLATMPTDYAPLLKDSLLDLFTKVAAVPKSAALSVSGKPQAFQSGNGKEFLFGNRVPLERNNTPISFSLNYTAEYTDSTGKKTKDTTVTRDFNVIRSAGAISVPPGTSLSCREQADIALYSQGKKLTRVRSPHKLLEVRLTPAEGDSCAKCMTALNSLVAKDSESLALPAKGKYYSAEIPRESLTVAVGDHIWQNAEIDSLVIIYVNADNPLDSVRKSYLYENRPSRMDMARHGDVAKLSANSDPPDGMQWLVVGADNLKVTPGKGGTCCRSVPAPLSDRDSTGYIGVTLSVSRAFAFNAVVFSNLGEVVNTLNFTMSDEELRKLAPGVEPGTRLLKVLWNNRAANGELAGTGAYIIKARAVIILDADESYPVNRIVTSRVGVLR